MTQEVSDNESATSLLGVLIIITALQIGQKGQAYDVKIRKGVQ